MRIIAGRFRGRKIVSLQGRAVRPTADRVKEALFQIIAPRCGGAAVLDLYAGSGNLGLEALSRGARECCFVDRSSACCDVIKKNLDLMGLRGAARVFRLDCSRAVKSLQRRGEQFDVVLADPPYGRGEKEPSEAKKILSVLNGCDIFSPRAVVVLEHSVDDNPLSEFAQFDLWKRRRYGETVLSFFIEVRDEPGNLSRQLRSDNVRAYRRHQEGDEDIRPPCGRRGPQS